MGQKSPQKLIIYPPKTYSLSPKTYSLKNLNVFNLLKMSWLRRFLRGGKN